MKRLASKAIATGLAAVFALASSNMAQAVTDITAAQRDHQYNQLVTGLNEMQARIEARRQAIAAQIRAASPSLSADAVTVGTELALNAELRAEADARWSAQTNQALGGSNINLPNAFERSVRGCTTDGYIYRVAYNLAFNMNELAAPPAPGTPTERQSLFYRLVKPDSTSILGVNGTATFMDALRAMNESIDSSMQTLTGKMIDETASMAITRPAFRDLASQTAQGITAEIKQRYGVTVTIRLDQPRPQSQARCGVGIANPMAGDAAPIPPSLGQR